MRLFLALLTTFAHAEYRAFELVITDAKGANPQIVLSTLDPNQYRMYYPTPMNARITYRATWKCRGRTGDNAPICPNPRAGAGAKP